MQRLFVAIDLPEAIKTQLQTLCSDLPGAKWVTHLQMHLTLRYIGDADEAQLAHIQTGLATVRATPFMMVLQGIGQFPPRGKPHVIWVGIEAESALNHLQQQIERVIRDSGFGNADHAFSPHITLARFRNPPPVEDVERYFANHQTFESDTFGIDEFILFSSQLAPSGSTYHRQGVFPLV